MDFKKEFDRKKVVLCQKYGIFVKICRIYGCKFHKECEKAL